MKAYILPTILVMFCLYGKAQNYNNGVSVEIVQKTDTTSIGQQFVLPNLQNMEVTMAKVTIQPGKSTGWHKHNFAVFAYVAKGHLTVNFENGKTLQFTENSSIAEVVNTYHNGTNNGNEDAVLYVYYLGEKGKPLSIRKE
ncbi:MAG: cupin domain-containing protein [Mariniphaga sp.]